jgi:hypothetical protein
LVDVRACGTPPRARAVVVTPLRGPNATCTTPWGRPWPSRRVRATIAYTFIVGSSLPFLECATLAAEAQAASASSGLAPGLRQLRHMYFYTLVLCAFVFGRKASSAQPVYLSYIQRYALGLRAFTLSCCVLRFISIYIRRATHWSAQRACATLKSLSVVLRRCVPPVVGQPPRGIQPEGECGTGGFTHRVAQHVCP